jgi:hypothetical protein
MGYTETGTCPEMMSRMLPTPVNKISSKIIILLKKLSDSRHFLRLLNMYTAIRLKFTSQ